MREVRILQAKDNRGGKNSANNKNARGGGDRQVTHVMAKCNPVMCIT